MLKALSKILLKATRERVSRIFENNKSNGVFLEMIMEAVHQ